MTDKYDTSMLPQVDLLRVCLSCWRRVPSLLSRTVHNQKFPGTSALVCTGSCGQRWNRVLQTHERQMSSSKNDESTDISTNPFFEKYKQKIKHLQEEDPEEFESRLEDMKTKASEKPPVEAQPESTQNKSFSVPPSSAGPRTWPPKSLDEVMKLDLVKDLPPDAIKTIWQEHHLNKDCIFSVVPKNDYEEIITKSQLNRSFLFPLPKGDGYEFYLCQFNGKDVFFTPLGMFQLLKENAPACLSVAHFPELKEEKGIVLMAGEYDDKVIKKSEALNLVKQMTLYYGKDAGERYKLLRTFHTQPDTFDHMQLIDEYEQNREYLENNPY